MNAQQRIIFLARQGCKNADIAIIISQEYNLTKETVFDIINNIIEGFELLARQEHPNYTQSKEL